MADDRRPDALGTHGLSATVITVALVAWGFISMLVGVGVMALIVMQWGVRALLAPSGDEFEWPAIGFLAFTLGAVLLMFGVSRIRRAKRGQA